MSMGGSVCDTGLCSRGVWIHKVASCAKAGILGHVQGWVLLRFPTAAASA